MGEFHIPHQPPIRFARDIISANTQECLVNASFDEIPTLGMLLEAAAQGSLAMAENNDTNKMGFLVSLKNIKLLKEPATKNYIVKVKLVSNLDIFRSKKFEIFEHEKCLVATGDFSVMLHN